VRVETPPPDPEPDPEPDPDPLAEEEAELEARFAELDRQEKAQAGPLSVRRA
jgi:hypothetical protein